MVKENRVSKYLLYAIGEIVLVVIGILIALQINDRSAQKKLERTNVKLMKKMQDELQINIERLQYLDTGYHFKGEAYGYTPILAKIDTGQLFVNEGLDTLRIAWMLNQSTFYPGGLYNMSSSVYQEMLSSGRFYSLGSAVLSNRIQRYYQLIEREEKYADKSNSVADASWEACKYGYNDLKADFDLYGMHALANHQWVLDPRSNDYLDLKTALRESYTATERNRRHARTMRAESETLIKALEDEIRAMQ